MENLYNVDSPIDRERRKNMNDTFGDILRRFNNLQMQINILSGDSSVEDVLTELTKAIDNANVTIEDIQAMAELYEAKLTEIEAVIINANNATSETIDAISDAREAIFDINNLIASMRYKGEYDFSLTYYPNNIVRYGKNSYVSLKEQQNVPPDDDGVNWQLIAMGGIDGTGAVSTVNNIEPDENGNVKLEFPTKQEFIEFDNRTTNNLAQRVINVKSPPPPLVAAIGDGVKDDQPAIQAVIDYANINGYNVYFPAGVYLLNNTVKRKGRVSLYGQNMMNTVLKFYKSSGGTIIDTANESLHGVTISNFKFIKDASVGGTVTGILGVVR